CAPSRLTRPPGHRQESSSRQPSRARAPPPPPPRAQFLPHPVPAAGRNRAVDNQGGHGRHPLLRRGLNSCPTPFPPPAGIELSTTRGWSRRRQELSCRRWGVESSPAGIELSTMGVARGVRRLTRVAHSEASFDDVRAEAS